MADDFIGGLGGSTPEGGQVGGANTNTTADQLRNQVLSQLAVSLASVVTALQAAFPQASTAITHTATAGADTLPAKPAGFLTITVSGSTFKVALYAA